LIQLLRTSANAPPRFEELEYADAASYMEGGRIVFTGSPEQLRQRLKAMGATL
jgi:ABC-type branched-subunit amino acid transport system ATPase component